MSSRHVADILPRQRKLHLGSTEPDNCIFWTTFDHDVTTLAVHSDGRCCDEDGFGLSLDEAAHVEEISNGFAHTSIRLCAQSVEERGPAAIAGLELFLHRKSASQEHATKRLATGSGGPEGWSSAAQQMLDYCSKAAPCGVVCRIFADLGKLAESLKGIASILAGQER